MIGSIEFRYRPIPAVRKEANAVTSEEFQAVYPLVISWIRETLASNTENARSVGSKGFARLPLYFGNEFLEATKVVAVDRVPVPPLSSFGLSRFAHFEQRDYDGIAYLNTLSRASRATRAFTFTNSSTSFSGQYSVPNASSICTPMVWRPSVIVTARWRTWRTSLNQASVDRTRSLTQNSSWLSD